MNHAVPMRILVVDDIQINRKLLCAMLEGAGHETVEAVDGLDALVKLAGEKIDALISDILMPNMDGYGLCNEVRKSASLSALPFIMYSSTYTTKSDRELAKSMGADDCLVKPASEATILKALDAAVLASTARHPRSPASALDQTTVRMKYSAALGNKLEEKNTELLQANLALKKAHLEISGLNADLEQRVRARTTELQTSNSMLERRNREIQNFYHTLSHELKTPLTSAREFVAIVIDGLAGPLNEKQNEFLHIALESCDQLRVYIDDLLDAARLETGKLQVQLAPSSLRDVVSQTISRFDRLAKERQISLSCECGDLPPAMVDPLRIMQVLTNLLSNALKFTPPGGSIRVRVLTDPDDARRQRISVRDDGCGIAADQLDRIFDRLYQVKSDATPVSPSLGLGLFICRELLALHGAKIAVASIQGKGTRFSFSVANAPRTQQPLLPIGEIK
jgi:signal transduction histidine kinase